MNRKLIDRVIADVRVRPLVWQNAWQEMLLEYGVPARDRAWDVAWNDDHPIEWVDPWNKIRTQAHAAGAVLGTAYQAASDAVLALARWEEAGTILTLPPAAVRLLIASGSPAALLMFPAVLVFSNPLTQLNGNNDA